MVDRPPRRMRETPSSLSNVIPCSTKPPKLVRRTLLSPVIQSTSLIAAFDVMPFRYRSVVSESTSSEMFPPAALPIKVLKLPVRLIFVKPSTVFVPVMLFVVAATPMVFVPVPLIVMLPAVTRLPLSSIVRLPPAPPPIATRAFGAVPALMLIRPPMAGFGLLVRRITSVWLLFTLVYRMIPPVFRPP